MLVINETVADPDDPYNVGLNGWIGRGGVYGWRVESLDDSGAVLRVDLNLYVEDAYVQTRHWLNYTEYIDVDIETRQATSANGTNLGTINYWIDPDVHEGDIVSIYGRPPYEMREEVRSPPDNPLQIPAGDFDCWTTLSFTRPDIPELSGPLYLWYDKGTGILVAASGLFYYDVVMMAMGIEAIEIIGSWGYSGGSVSSQPSTFVLQSQGTSPLRSPLASMSADLNNDGAVNIQDVALVASAYGSAVGDLGYKAQSDLNKDGVINIKDLAIVAVNFRDFRTL
jgi:hypothetical protein